MMKSAARKLPSSYRAMVLTKPGGVSNFSLQDRPLTMPTTGKQLLVKVSACAIAYRDILDRQGAFKFIKQPTVLGHEFSGEVAARAGEEKEEAATFKVGDKVMSLHWDQDGAWPTPLNQAGAVDTMFGLTCDGGYAEYALANSGALVPQPKHLDPVAAACVVSTYGTSWSGMVTKGRLQPGQRVLVTGASGGVGVAALQLAKAFGCSTTGVTTSSAKCDFLRDVGADEALVANDDGQFRVPENQRPDVILEAVGGPTFMSSLRCIKPGGTIVLVGNVTNAKVSLPLGACILNSITIIGTDSIQRDDMINNCTPFLEKHDIRPRLSAEAKRLEDIPALHTLVEERKAQGRFVVVP